MIHSVWKTLLRNSTLKLAKLLETTNCYYCNKDNARKLYTIDGFKNDPRLFQVVECCNCSLVYINPRYSNDENNERYAKEYFVDKVIDPSGRVRSFVTDRQNKVNDHKIEFNYLRRYKKTGRILDYGAAAGYFLEALDGDWDKYALDISGFALDSIRDKNVTKICKTLIHAKFNDNYFDVVYAGHTLDRLIDLKKNIQELKRIIKNDGIIFVTLPNIGSLCSRIFKENYRLLYANHLIYFTPKTVKRFFNEVGLEIIDVKYPFYNTSFFSWASLLGNFIKIIIKLCFNCLRIKTKMISPPFWGNVMCVIIKNDDEKK